MCSNLFWYSTHSLCFSLSITLPLSLSAHSPLNFPSSLSLIMCSQLTLPPSDSNNIPSIHPSNQLPTHYLFFACHTFCLVCHSLRPFLNPTNFLPRRSRVTPTTLTTTWRTSTKRQTTRTRRAVTGRWCLGSTLSIWQMGLARRSSTRWTRTLVTQQRSPTKGEAGRGLHRYQGLLVVVVSQHPLALPLSRQPSVAPLRQPK